MFVVKVCPFQTPTETLAAGATAFGLLCGLPHRAEDLVTPDQARAIAALGTAIGARSVQAHGNLPPEELRRLRALLPGHRIIKAIHVDAAANAVLARGRPTLPHADVILQGSRTADRLGGTGRLHERPSAAPSPPPSHRCPSSSLAA